ncbi:SnoaL-like domain-containing protein [Actinopolyspora sp. BKK1]|nr:SnoaL-like domain-containing protein [Actinopolyspora sp. BKK2]NHE78459.1 SnoaL-like domain-containing protein [Actinopolyspora sp. BKK1]
MTLLDDGRVSEWAATFTEDAVFEETSMPEALCGREMIRDSVRDGVTEIEAAGLDFRHWFGMLDVEQLPDSSVRARFSSLAVVTPPGGQLEVRGNVVGHDHLVPNGSSWLVCHRRLRIDGTG